MFSRVVVPLDGSELAEAALPMAKMLAAGENGELHLVHVLEELPAYSLKMSQDDMEWEEMGTAAAADYLESQVQRVEETASGRVVANVVRGEDRVTDGLERYCEENAADLVVMASHGEGGFRRFWLGSVADEMVRRTRVPLLLLRPEDPEGSALPTEPFHQVVVPLDGSPEAEMALEQGQRLAEAFGSRIVLLQVVAPGEGLARFRADPAAVERSGLTEDLRDEAARYLERVATDLRNRGTGTASVESEVVGAENPAEGIMDRADSGSVIVMATHGRGGFARMVVGSVADKVLRGGTVPLLLVRAPEQA